MLSTADVRILWRLLCAALLACALGMGCSDEDSPQAADGLTHWLRSCETDATCESGDACTCGVCTRECEDPQDCRGGSLCVAATTAPVQEQCGAQAAVPICLPECSAADPCPASGHACREGQCIVVVEPTQPGGGTGDAGAGGGQDAGGTGANPVCELPIVVGPCEAAIPAFGFNTDSGQCEPFTYGGCQGNDNNFASMAECDAACGDGSTGSGSDPCEACLAGGGTWQPEASECTTNCDIADISCFTDSCPGDCADDCGACFSQGECEAAGCTWQQAAEAMWCTM